MKRDKDNMTRRIIRLVGLFVTCTLIRLAGGYVALALQTGLMAIYQAITHIGMETGTIRNYLCVSLDVSHIVLEGVLITAVVKLIQLYVWHKELTQSIEDVAKGPLNIWAKLWIISVGSFVLQLLCVGAISLQFIGKSIWAFITQTDVPTFELTKKFGDYLFLVCEGWVVLQIIKVIIWRFHRQLRRESRRKARKERG